ncbi:hypothetical protein NBRC10512_005837, partial [Rhodotorula toruloides]
MSADNYTIESRVQLNDGETYPRFGLGKSPGRKLPWGARSLPKRLLTGVYVTEPGAETYNAVTWALEAGYR